MPFGLNQSLRFQATVGIRQGKQSCAAQKYWNQVLRNTPGWSGQIHLTNLIISELGNPPLPFGPNQSLKYIIYKYHTNVIQILYKYYKNCRQMLHECCTNRKRIHNWQSGEAVVTGSGASSTAEKGLLFATRNTNNVYFFMV